MNNEIKILKNVLGLAIERKKEHDKNEPTSFSLGNGDISKLMDTPRVAKGNLINYLNSLDFETIKFIQTVMYLGRDNEYPKLGSGKERYLELRRVFDERGWNTKEIAISQIVQKVPLDRYLSDGIKILMN